MNPKKLTPEHNHDHYFIEENCVYESYRTIRGLRYRPIAVVIMDNNEKLSKTDIEQVNRILEANYC